MSENKYLENLYAKLIAMFIATHAGLVGASNYWGDDIKKLVLGYPKKPEIELNSTARQNVDVQEIFNNYKTEDFSEDNDKTALARQIMGECSGCSKIEKIAVAFTVINRAYDGQKWNGEGVKESIFKSGQYSCFNKWIIEKVLVKNRYGKIIKKKNGKPLTKKVKKLNSRLACLKDPMKCEPKEFQEDRILAGEILAGKYKDPTRGAKFYFNPNTIATPYWVKNLERVYVPETIHWFYREKRR